MSVVAARIAIAVRIPRLDRYKHERTSLGLNTPPESSPSPPRSDGWTSGWGTNDDWGAPPTPPEITAAAMAKTREHQAQPTTSITIPHLLRRCVIHTTLIEIYAMYALMLMLLWVLPNQRRQTQPTRQMCRLFKVYITVWDISLVAKNYVGLVMRQLCNCRMIY